MGGSGEASDAFEALEREGGLKKQAWELMGVSLRSHKPSRTVFEQKEQGVLSSRKGDESPPSSPI